MEQSPVLLLCSLDCRSDLKLDIRRLAQRLQDSGVFQQVLVEGPLCRNHLKKLSCLKGKKILFGGCSVLAAGDFYVRAARALSLEQGDTLAVNVMEDILQRYTGSAELEQNLYGRLLASARILERAKSVPEETLVARPRVLVYGSGLSGLHATLELATAGVPVDVLPTLDGPVSPGCLNVLLQPRRPVELLCTRVREQENVSFLEAGDELLARGRAGGFELDGAGGDRREYGCIVFAPERVEDDPAEAGSLNLTQLYTRLEEGEKLTGTCVILFDHGFQTAPEIFRDGLAAAYTIRTAGRARVWVLSRNVQVSLPDLEALYTSCREAGVLFLKYREPLAIDNVYGDFVLSGLDAQSGRRFRLPHPEVMVIPRPARLSEAALRFAGLLELRLFRDAYAQPDSLWRLAQGTSRPGVFACGAARGHLSAPGVEQDAEALACAVRQRLQPGGIAVPERLAVVDGEKCAVCLTCGRACPSGAMGRDYEQRCAVVDPGSCQACGVCVAACPAQAIQLRNLGAEALSAGIEALT